MLNSLWFSDVSGIIYIPQCLPKTRNARTRNTGGTVKNQGTANYRTPKNNGGTTEHPGITTEHQRSTSGHPGTTEPYKTKNNCSIF